MSNKISQAVRIKEFGERLHILFETTDIYEIAQKLQMSYDATRKYIKEGRVTLPLLIKIVNLTGCSLDWLVFGKGKPHKSSMKIRDMFKDLIAEVIEERDLANYYEADLSEIVPKKRKKGTIIVPDQSQVEDLIEK